MKLQESVGLHLADTNLFSPPTDPLLITIIFKEKHNKKNKLLRELSACGVVLLHEVGLMPAAARLS